MYFYIDADAGTRAQVDGEMGRWGGEIERWGDGEMVKQGAIFILFSLFYCSNS